LGISEHAEQAAGDGVETEGVVTGSTAAGHSVLSTQYLVLGTRPDQAQPGAEPPVRNPKSQIPNLKSSVEETAIAIEALLAVCPPTSDLRSPTSAPVAAASRGLAWLIDRVEAGQHRQPAPIGFYFAKMWYYEKLYPLTFTVAALGRARRQFARLEHPDSPADPAPARAP